MTTCQDVANLAVVAATTAPFGTYYLSLTNEMCWDAVMRCAQFAGLIDQTRYDAIRRYYYNLVGIHDHPVASAGDMANLAAGHALGFFEWDGIQWHCVHAMLSVGAGQAAGNKNACIGIGNPNGWERLDLQHGLAWSNNVTPGVDDGFLGGYVQLPGRRFYVRSRPITRLAGVVQA
jgi:hypothetical protein